MVGYYVVPRAKRQDAQQALTKQTYHVEPNNPDCFIITLLDMEQKRVKKKKSWSCPPRRKQLINVAVQRKLFGGGVLVLCCSHSAAADDEARSDEEMRSHTV